MDHLGRDVHDVRDGLHLLTEYAIVHFEEDERAKKPYIPYDTVSIEAEFGLPRREGAESVASVEEDISRSLF